VMVGEMNGEMSEKANGKIYRKTYSENGGE
jgi:hypothetical protein